MTDGFFEKKLIKKCSETIIRNFQGKNSIEINTKKKLVHLKNLLIIYC